MTVKVHFSRDRAPGQVMSFVRGEMSENKSVHPDAHQNGEA
jgi:hypothetical protein